MKKDQTSYRDSYRFFDTVIAIQSDSPKFLDLFAAVYQRFRIDGEPHGEIHATYYVMTQDNTLVIDGETLVLDDSEMLADRAYEHILNSVVAKIRTHVLIHAGVVSWNNQGIIFPAYSGHGKTTLILELVRHGFKFLSDEIAPFDRQQRRWIAPFPRSLRVRPNTLALCGYTNFPFTNSGHRSTPPTSWRDKLVLDIEQIRPQSLGGTCLGKYIIVLSNPLGISRGLEELDRTLHFVLKHITADLVQEIQTITGVKDVSSVPDTRFPVLRLCVERGTRVILQVEEICHRQGVHILDVVKGGEYLPDFQTSPRLEPISSAEATMELIRRFRGGPNSALLHQEHQGSTTRLFMELADIVSEIQCYRLFVGRLDEMAGLIYNLVST